MDIGEGTSGTPADVPGVRLKMQSVLKLVEKIMKKMNKNNEIEGK